MVKIAFFKKRDFLLVPIAYILFGIYLTLFQNSFIYHPDSESKCPQLEAYRITDSTVRGFYISSDAAEQLIVVYHGNAGRACNRTYFIPFAEASNASLLLVEYPGFGETEKVSTNAILEYIPEVIHFTTSLEYPRTVLIGESIGSAFASYHNKKANADTLILLSPFSSLHSMTRRVVPIYPARIMLENTLPVIDWAQSSEETFILATANDRVIPIKESMQVHEAAIPNSILYVFDEGDHNTIFEVESFRNTLLEILVKS